uniref:plasmid recombination protein n=1 Tax=Alistipes shahii TaxID=328814 RepID=UPI00241D0CB8
PAWSTVEKRREDVDRAAKAEGRRATRKDAVLMADFVVTLPENVRAGDEGAFFRYTYEWLANRVGSENLMGGFVHKDEIRTDGSPVRAHMHAPFTPILDGRFNFKKMCPRTFYQSLHKDLGDYLERQLGYRPEVELNEETRAQRVYTDKSVDIDKVRGAVDRAVVEPARQEAEKAMAKARAAGAEEARTRVKLGALTAEVNKKRDLAADLDGRISEKTAEIHVLNGEKSQILEKLKAEQARLEGVQRNSAEARGRVAELEIAVERERVRAAELGREVEGARARVGQLERAVERVRAAVRSVLETLRTVPAALAVAMGHRAPSAAAFRAARAAEAVGVADTGARAVPEPQERPEHSQGRSEGQDGKAPSTKAIKARLSALETAKNDEKGRMRSWHH